MIVTETAVAQYILAEDLELVIALTCSVKVVDMIVVGPVQEEAGGTTVEAQAQEEVAGNSFVDLERTDWLAGVDYEVDFLVVAWLQEACEDGFLAVQVH